jgi:hypothetical protein
VAARKKSKIPETEKEKEGKRTKPQIKPHSVCLVKYKIRLEKNN